MLFCQLPILLLKEMYRTLEVEGKIIVMTPSWEYTYWGPFYIDPTHIRPFTKKSLDTFINLKRSDNEIKRNLEQMRAIDNGLLIRSGFVDKTPIGVDTKEDFLKVTQEMKL